MIARVYWEERDSFGMDSMTSTALPLVQQQLLIRRATLLDVKDVSTDEICIELELKKEADPGKVLAYLFKHTPLQINFAVNLTCLVPVEQNPEVGRPERLGLKAILWHQGESDSSAPLAPGYEAKLHDLVELAPSDVLRGVEGSIDVAIANPPYLVDPGKRVYRDGGGGICERIARETRAHLNEGGLLQMASRRRKLLDYLKRHNLPKYNELLQKLNLRK